MLRQLIFCRPSLVLLLATAMLTRTVHAEAGALRAAAVKVDITPADPSKLTNQWGVPFVGVHDKTYARVLVVNSGSSTAAIIAIDTVEVSDAFSARLAKETRIPTSNIAITATHNHNAPIVGMVDASGMHPAGPGGAAFLAKLHDDLVKAVKLAQASLQPARMGVATGASSININRDQPIPGGGYRMGVDPFGTSDKTVWVLKFESLRGEPIALLINYAVHGTIIGMKNNLLTGEVAGATSRFVEQSYKNKAVALWTLGAAGDQAPIITDAESDPSNFEPVNVLGRILGEEVVRVANGIDPKAMVTQAAVWGAEKFVTCPGQKDDGGRPTPGSQGNSGEAGPASFRLGVIMIDKIALTEVSAEVVTNIYQKLRKQSPYTNTIMLTLANGRIGYIPDDEAYDLGKPDSRMAALKKGCGEAAIVNGLLDLIRQY